jgi:hypothetical protein
MGKLGLSHFGGVPGGRIQLLRACERIVKTPDHSAQIGVLQQAPSEEDFKLSNNLIVRFILRKE